MNERLTLQDLIDILAKKQDITKKDAETFLRELISVISENIEKNEPVRIKDFGVFKLVKVNARRSVDVNTGEAIEIPAHYKLSFTPDRLLKEAINRPFAHFESVILEEGVTFDNVESEERIEDGEDAEDVDVTIDEEIVEIEPAISDTTETNTDAILLADEAIREEPEGVESITANILTKEDEVITGETVVGEAEPVEEIAEIVENTEPTDIPEPDREIAETEEPIIDEEPIEDRTIKPNMATILASARSESDEMFERHRRKTKRRRFISLFFVLILIIAAFAAGGFYMQEIMDFIDGQPRVDDKYKTTVVFEKDLPTDSIATEKVIAPADSIAMVADKPISQLEKKVDQPVQDKNKPLAVHVLEYGETMRLISLKHYGHKSFWPYIYEENKSAIKNPNSVPVGTKLVIPSPTKYGIDAKNKDSIEKAKALEAKLVNEMGL
ncbi:MAG: HU family DNA-binding protein [Dysgonomonas sp.]